MPQLTQEQTQQYLNLINQANVHRIVYSALLSSLSNPSKSIDDLNSYLSKRTKIDISQFQAITATKSAPVLEVKLQPAAEQKAEVKPAPQEPAPTPEPAIEAKPAPIPEVKIEQKPEVKVEVKPTPQEPAPTPEKNPEVKIEQPKPVVLEFYTCTDSDSPIKNTNPSVVNNGTNLQEAIKQCADWSESADNSSYVFYKNECTFVPEAILAAAMCYSTVIPAHIPNLSKHTPGIYSCNNNVRAEKPFTHLYGNEAGRAQQLKDCANWMLDGNSALALGSNACEEFTNYQEMLAGCLNP